MTGTSSAMASKQLVHIGKGPWGQNYLNTYKELPVDVQVADRSSWRSLLDEEPDGVIICTPPDTHVEIARYALERNIPVLIEKPLALSLEEASILQGYNAPILVNHLYLFSQGYQSLKVAVGNNPVTHIDTVGIGTRGHDGYSALWDYGPHDIAMVIDLMSSMPEQVSAKIEGGGQIYLLELTFGSITANCRIGIGTERCRRVSVQYVQGREVFEDKGNEEPRPLYASIQTFLSAIDGVIDSRMGLPLAFKVLKVIEACDLSLNLQQPVLI